MKTHQLFLHETDLHILLCSSILLRPLPNPRLAAYQLFRFWEAPSRLKKFILPVMRGEESSVQKWFLNAAEERLGMTLYGLCSHPLDHSDHLCLADQTTFMNAYIPYVTPVSF
ncbi:hypothetical protein QQF64_017823 [Cirrhinus molitorella]|uniref:Uncharacterized protein n=1 Tax=Cirrhinus molitorella TaxID=172907 RepID=A0ABR3LJQ7_9TELE